MHENQLTIFDIIDKQDANKNLLTADHFNFETRNHRFVYWLLAKGKIIGEEYRMYEFIIWINQSVCEFKRISGFTENTPISHIHGFHSRFNEFLKNI